MLFVQGHSDASQHHLRHALGEDYVRGANAAVHAIRRINVGTLDFPGLRSQYEWEQSVVPPVLAGLYARAAQTLSRARGASRFRLLGEGKNPYWILAVKGPTGSAARIVVAMGTPATLYLCIAAHTASNRLSAIHSGTFRVAPLHEPLVGMVREWNHCLARRRLPKLNGQAGRKHCGCAASITQF